MARVLTPDEGEVVTVTEAELPKVTDPDPDVTYTVRLMSDRRYRDIARRHTKKRPNHRGEMVEVTDHEALGREVLDTILVGWTGIVARTTDGELVAVPCTIDTKVQLEPAVRGALLDFAFSNQRVEAQARAESFR